MILSAGLTPAWQQVLVFHEFHVGEVNRACEARWYAQGKVLNAGIAAHHLSGPSLTLAPLGGPALRPMDAEFSALGVPHRWIVTETPTRVCTTILDRGKGTTTELVENGRPLRPVELADFLAAYAEEAARASVVILAGSLPDGTPPSFYRELLERTPCPAVLDFRGEGLLSTLDLKPLVVKPNREELAKTIGRPLEDDASLLDAMRSLNRRGAQWVVVTHGAGRIWLTSESEAYRLQPAPVETVVNAIGSGDSMAAGIAWAVRDGRTMPDAVRFGIAAAADNLRRLETGRLDPIWVQQHAAAIRYRNV